MTTPPPGPSESGPPSATTRYAAAAAAWEAGEGVPPVAGDRPAAERLLNLSPAERSKMGPEECADACVVLSVHAAFLTRLAQAQEAEAFLCAERLDRLLLPVMGGYAAFSFQERRALAMAERPHANALDLERVAAAAKAKRLLFFANRVEAVAKAFAGLGNSRRRGREFGD